VTLTQGKKREGPPHTLRVKKIRDPGQRSWAPHPIGPKLKKEDKMEDPKVLKRLKWENLENPKGN